MEFQAGSIGIIRTGSKFSLLGYKVISPKVYEETNPHLNVAVEVEIFLGVDDKWYSRIIKRAGIKIGGGFLRFGAGRSDVVGPFETNEAVVAWVGPLPMQQKE